MNTYATAYTHVYGLLAEDEDLMAGVGGRVYQGTVPALKPVFPCILIQPYGDATSVLGVGPTQAATSVEVSVRVIAPDTSLNALVAIAEAMDEILQASSSTNSHGHVASCVRIAETDMTELSDGQVWRYLGARYRLLLTV